MKATAVIAVLIALVAVIGVGVFLALGNTGEDSTIVLEEAVGDDGILSDNAEKNIIDSIGKEDGSNVEVRITSERSDTASISSKLLKATTNSGASISFVIKGTSAKISNKTLNALNSGNVSFTVKEATVPKEYAELEGRPAYDLTLECGGSVVSSFSDHVQVSIPYKLKSGEKSGNLYVAYLGKTIERLDCTFKSDSVRFSTNHFSSYVIAYRHTDSVEPREIQSTSPSQWSYVGGDVGSFGVTDSKTPITESDMRMLWMVTSDTETSSSNWKTPSSSLCVDDKVYYYKGQDSMLYCVDVATGNTIAKAACPSKTVYNMAITYGDGKVFAVTSTGSTSILYAFDAETLKQLFVSVPVEGGETQGTITYNDGKVFFGTYSGDYACFSTEDKNKARSDEKVEPLWLLKHKGWYNATPAFFDDYIVLVQRGFDDMGAIAYFMDANTGKVIDMMKFDREYASSGATAYEGRVYIPLNRVHDRTITDPNENTPDKLAIRSYKITSSGFDRSSEKFWESDDSYWNDNHGGRVWGGTQSIPVIWNDTIYIGGGGKTLGTDEPLWIIDIDKNGNMKSRAYLKDVCTKATPVISTAYSTKENGYAVYIYVMEYGHVYQGESSESTNGYADIFVIKDSKEKGTSIVFKMRPDPTQFCYQSFSISKNGYVLIRNDSTLLCYGVENRYTAEDVSSSIERFLSMYDDGNVNHRDYQRIISRYSELSEDDKAKVTNYSKLEGVCVTLRLETVSKDNVIKVPKGSIVDIPEVAVPKGKVLTGWMDGKSAWTSFNTPVMKDTVLTPVYADAVTIKLNPQNGASAYEIQSAKGSELPFIYDPSKEGYQFGGWYDGSTLYKPNETKVSKNVTLTAKWLEVSLLKFDTDGGSPVTGKYYGVYDKPLGNLPVSVKAGYTFKGWYYDGKEYTSQTVYKFNDGITLKAKWAENTSTTIDNGKGLSITGKFPAESSLSTGSLNVTGNTYKSISKECKEKTGSDPDCVLVTLKGDGVDNKLPLKVKIKANSSYNGKEVQVFYYLNKVVTVKGKVIDGHLVFDAYGSNVLGGVQLSFGVGSGVMEKGSW